MADAWIHEYRQNARAVFLRESLTNLIPDRKKRIQDVQRTLNLWEPLLKDLDTRKNKVSSVRNLEREIRDLVSRLNSVLENYSNEDQSRRGRTIIRKFIDDFKSSRTVDLDVKEINKQIRRIILNMSTTYSVLALSPAEEEISHSANENPETEIPQKLRRSISASGENDIVGKYYRLEILKSALLDDKDRVICISGMGGMGKTTLAHKLYTDRDVQFHFEIRSAVEIGQEFGVRNVLEIFLEQFPEGKEIIKQPHLTNETLKEHFEKYAKDRRYLFVLDDIRSMNDWKFLRKFFPNNQKGSKLMLTTRSTKVAIHASEEEYEQGGVHAMRPLSMSESLELFQKPAFFWDLNGETEENSFKEKKMQEVLELCSGVPSAIIAVREVLAAKHTPYEWEQVLQDCNLLIDKDRPVEQIVSQKPISDLIFDDLPYHLKPCFLFLGLFPEGSKIEVKHLYFLWTAEGLISRNDGQKNETTMDLAESYLSNLVQRKIVEVEKEETPSLRKYKSCWVHEHMKNHCLMKGKEYFFKVLGFGQKTPKVSDSSSTSNPVRRMALHLDYGSSSSTSNSFDQIRNEEVDKLWSLVFLNPRDHQMKLEWPRRMFYPKKYRTLKALSFERVDFQESGLPRGTTKLISLKYLSFKGCKLGVLPSSIGNLSFLEILDIQVSGPIIIPNVLSKMVKLVYLYFPLEFQTPNNDKLYLGSLKELEILENFDTTVCNAADLFKMTNLRHLSATVKGILGTVKEILGDLEQIVGRLDVTSENTSVLYPSIKVENLDCYTEERHSVFRKLLNCQILHTLHMDGILDRYHHTMKSLKA